MSAIKEQCQAGLHVVARRRGWGIIREPGDQELNVYRTKQAAIEAALETVETGELVHVHFPDGEFQETLSPE